MDKFEICTRLCAAQNAFVFCDRIQGPVNVAKPIRTFREIKVTFFCALVGCET